MCCRELKAKSAARVSDLSDCYHTQIFADDYHAALTTTACLVGLDVPMSLLDQFYKYLMLSGVELYDFATLC